MLRIFLFIFLVLSCLQMLCKEESTIYIPESPTSHLRVINFFKRWSNIAVLGNETEIIDSLECNYSSGYIDIADDSLHIELFDNYVHQLINYDTVCYLNKENYYTLFLISKNQTISSLLVQDIQLSSLDCSFIRLFNNSAAGEPFIFSLNSQIDTVSYFSLPLHGISNYQIILDTLYTPSLRIIPIGLGGAYGFIPVEKNTQYLIVITDTFPITDSWYPYVVLIFTDIIDDREYYRLY